MAPPVDIKYDRLVRRSKDDNFDRIVDRLGSIVDKGSGSADDDRTSRLSELTAIALRGFGPFPTHLGTGVCWDELESTLKNNP